jgi:hypothetical protein
MSERSPERVGQVVEVDGFAYVWHGSLPLILGEAVLLPETWISRIRRGPGVFRGTVTRLGSDYAGKLSEVVDRA